MRDWLPMVIVALAFAGCLAVYATLRLNGTEAGVLDELLLLIGGGVVALGTPIARAR